MLVNAFTGRKAPPTEAELGAALGAARNTWEQFLDCLAQEFGAGDSEWKSYSPKAGWSLRVRRRKRTIVWLVPGHGCFEVLFILGDRAMPAARAAKLPKAIASALEHAPRYPEGTGLRFTVQTPRNLRALKQLAAIKVAG